MGRQPGLACSWSHTQHRILQAERLAIVHPVLPAASCRPSPTTQDTALPLSSKKGITSPRSYPDDAPQCPQSPRRQEGWSACSLSFWFAVNLTPAYPALSILRGQLFLATHVTHAASSH